MIPVALWSKYPNSFLSGKIIPRLKNKGINVVKLLSNKTKDFDLSSIEVVLFMKEMAGHSEQDQLKKIIKNKQIICISRKSSTWDSWIEELQMKSFKFESVDESQIQNLLNDYMFLRKKGLLVNDIVPKLAKYWVKGKLTNSNQLRLYILKVINAGKASPEFMEFYNNLPKVISAKKREHEPENNTEDNAESQVDTLEASAPALDDEQKEWKEIYEDELNKQLEKIKLLEKQLAEVKKSSPMEPNDKVKSILKIDDVVSLGMIQKSEAYDLIIKYCKNK